MYNYLDYESDRYRIRERFARHCNQKTTIEDIGELLDELTLDSKARDPESFQAQHHLLEQPSLGERDITEKNLYWYDNMMGSLDVHQPQWIDDAHTLEETNDLYFKSKNQILEKVKWNDEHRDHSLEALTPDERLEITMFHSMKQDPYYKHHLRNHLSKYADERNQTALSVYTGIYDANPDEFTKFDRINLFDFRRSLPQKERIAKLDSAGRAWGSGKRKNAIAVAYVKAGSGKITVNKRPLLQYFLMPSQRQRIMIPLSATQYTCLVDVVINVRGGGTSGQCEACIPAIAKAIQAYDVQTRPIIKYLRLHRNDPRRVERKHIGKKKARKGQTYVRR